MVKKGKKAEAAPQDAPAGESQEEAEPAPAARLTPEQKRIAESREALKHPCPAGQQFFEAPDGFIIMGEAKHHHVTYRMGNGKTMLINPRR